MTSPTLNQKEADHQIFVKWCAANPIKPERSDLLGYISNAVDAAVAISHENPTAANLAITAEALRLEAWAKWRHVHHDIPSYAATCANYTTERAAAAAASAVIAAAAAAAAPADAAAADKAAAAVAASNAAADIARDAITRHTASIAASDAAVAAAVNAHIAAVNAAINATVD